VKVLVVAPHPDDETLGCGGTLLRHAEDGDDIYWVSVTGIDVASGWPVDMVQRREREIQAVSAMYGFLSL